MTIRLLQLWCGTHWPYVFMLLIARMQDWEPSIINRHVSEIIQLVERILSEGSG